MRFVVTGSDALPGHAIAAALRREGYDVVGLEQSGTRAPENVARALREARPTVVINAFTAAVVDNSDLVDETESGKGQEAIPSEVSAVLEYVREHDVPLIQLSTCNVFDGMSETPYKPSERPNPMTSAGAQSWLIEQWIRQHLTHALVLRLGWIIGREPGNLLERVVEAWRERRPAYFSDRHRGNPTAPEDVARVVSAIAKQILCDAPVWGVYHYAGAETVSHLAFARALAEYWMTPDEIGELIGLASPEDIAQMQEPINTALSCVEIRDTFGIKQHPWRNYLSSLVEGLVRQAPSSRAAETPTVTAVKTGV